MIVEAARKFTSLAIPSQDQLLPAEESALIAALEEQYGSLYDKASYGLSL
jgi:hypothetical protein